MTAKELHDLYNEWQEALDVAQEKWDQYIESREFNHQEEIYQQYRELRDLSDKLEKQYKEHATRYDPEFS